MLKKLKLKKTFHQLFPLDANFIVEKNLNHWKPNATFLSKYEIWQNVIYKIKSTNMKLILSHEIITKKWINYATQFNFGIQHVKIKYDWILRIDADEYFQDLNSIGKIMKKICLGEYSQINGVSLNRRIKF